MQGPHLLVKGRSMLEQGPGVLVKGRERSHARFLEANAGSEPRCGWVKEPDMVAGEGLTCNTQH